jgi:hypothetical protein
MACSKIFSGDMPEITSEIIKQFKNDFSTLYSCILVNRLMCRTAIPLLWENPFSVPTQNCQFIEIYLNYLNETDKTKLSEIGFHSNLIPSTNTLFNYPSFIKCLNTFKMIFFIEKWVVRAISTYKKTNNTYTYSSAVNFKEFSKIIYSSLFKIFINNEVNLNIFEAEIITDKNCDFFENVIELIIQNPNLISTVKILKLHIYNISDVNLTKINPFLSFLSSNCNNISSLYLRFNNMFIKTFSHIINSQQNLEKISFSNIVPLHLLLSLRNSNYSNTLKTIVFYSVDFKNTINLTEVFEQLNVLESIHILYCHSLNSSFVQQIINLSKPFKLRSLFMSEIFPIESFQLLLQKSGDYLENIGFESLTNSNELLILITTYCSKIKIFELRGLDDQNTYSALDLIKNVSHNLNCLFIDNYSNSYELSSIILLNLGKILPSRLEYLNLSFKFKVDDFKIFLETSKNTFIKRLLIRNRTSRERENILPCIKEYIMKNRRVEYLAVDTDKKELFSLKNEVKEFESHNIKVQSYDNFNICCYKYIRDI